MTVIENQTFDAERALYGSCGVLARNCTFDGPADGESAFKESRDIAAEACLFCLRYPFWHDRGLSIANSEMTSTCRAALWYCENVKVADTKMHGIKALRECSDIEISGCDIISPEFGWFNRRVKMEDTTAESEYFMMRSSELLFRNVKMKGKYAFQYIEDCVFENCVFDTKDAFWHAKNVTVKNSIVKGEYLAWYSENLTLENCVITGTQPLCYCKGLKIRNCEMHEADLSFERSEVDAVISTPVISIKNPLKGRITAPAVGEIIRNIPGADGEVIIGKASASQGVCA